MGSGFESLSSFCCSDKLANKLISSLLLEKVIAKPKTKTFMLRLKTGLSF